MPSRLMILVIVTFWCAVTATVLYRDVWPHYFSDAPPSIAIDLTDEATQRTDTRWSIYRGETKIGAMSSQMGYDTRNDHFWFKNDYSKLKLEAGGAGPAKVELDFPRLTTYLTVTREGQFVGQSITGEMRLLIGGLELGSGGANVYGSVQNGLLIGRCQVRYPSSAANWTFERDLDPVPVPEGQVLNPMMPVNRLRNVTPGRRWVIREVDPLKDAIATLGKEIFKEHKVGAGLGLPNGENNELIAEVLSEKQFLPQREGPDIECHIISYRGERATAKTWVSIVDGRVMRQEASVAGEQLRFEREN